MNIICGNWIEKLSILFMLVNFNTAMFIINSNYVLLWNLLYVYVPLYEMVNEKITTHVHSQCSQEGKSILVNSNFTNTLTELHMSLMCAISHHKISVE